MAGAYERPDGLTDAEWQMFLNEMEAHDEALRKRTCPKCGSPLTKRLDPRQVGESEALGLWYNYRCTLRGCGFAVDQREAN